MSRFDDIDFAGLSPPDVVEALDYEVILTMILARYRDKAEKRGLESQATVLLESDPARILLEVAAELVVIERQRKNDAARAVLLATATGADLDHVAAHYKVRRGLIDPGDDRAIPPRPPVYENDTSLRRRAHLAYEALSVAGPRGAYIYHALSAHPLVADAWAEMTSPGHVLVTVLGATGDGTPTEEVMSAVRDRLVPADAMQDVRPDSDFVSIAPAQVSHYRVKACLDLYVMPDAEIALAAARDGVSAYVRRQHRLGEPVALSGLDAALHVAAVREVIIREPTATLPADPRGAWFCEGIEIEVGGGLS